MKNNVLWDIAVQKARALPSDFEEVLKKYKQNYPDRVESKKIGKSKKTTAILKRINNFELHLIVYEKISGSTSGFYCLFDLQNSKVYKRSIITQKTGFDDFQNNVSHILMKGK